MKALVFISFWKVLQKGNVMLRHINWWKEGEFCNQFCNIVGTFGQSLEHVFAQYLCSASEVKSECPGMLSWLQSGTPLYFYSILRESGNSKSGQISLCLLVISSVWFYFLLEISKLCCVFKSFYMVSLKASPVKVVLSVCLKVVSLTGMCFCAADGCVW